MSGGVITAIVLAGVLFIFLLTIFLLMPKKVYFTALFSGVYVSAFKLISMKLRKENFGEIVNSYILSKKSHLKISFYELEMIASGGGNPSAIVTGLCTAKNAKLDITLDFAKAVDASGMNFLDVVKECASPRVVEVPLISGVAKDKQEVNVKVSLTLKPILDNFLEGVGVDTISARAVEAVITRISNAEKASQLVSKPQYLDKAIFDAGVDDDSKYELVSADVVHIDFGENKALIEEKEQIEKQRIIASNQLEHRRLTAIAVEQEMKAKAEEMKAKVIANEAEVPKAIIKAIEEGKIKDIVDFYKLENLQVDTEMKRRLFEKKDNPNRR